MKFTVTAAKILAWVDEDLKNQHEVPLSYVKDQAWYGEFFKNNKEVFDEVMSKRHSIMESHFEMEEGRIRTENKIIETKEKVKGKYFWNKDKEVIKKTPTTEYVFKEGRTMEGYQMAMNEFMQEQYSVNTKPKIFSKFPVIINL